MKKTLAAVAVLGAFAGSALAADVQLYGLIDMGVRYLHSDMDANFVHYSDPSLGTDGLVGADATDAFEMKSGMQSGSRFGFKGTEDLGNGLTVGFILENGFDADTGADGTMFNRESSLFIQGDFGKLAMGRIGSINGGVSSWGKHGVMSAFGTSWGDYAAQADTIFGGAGQWDNMIAYETPSFAGFKVFAQYGMGSADENESTSDRYYAIGASYTNGPLNLYLAVDSINYATAGDNAVGPDSEVDDALTVRFGGNYDFDVVKIFGGVSYFDNARLSSFSGAATDWIGSSYYQSTKGKFNWDASELYVEGWSVGLSANIPLAGGNALIGAGYMDAELTDTTQDPGFRAAGIEMDRWVVSAGYDYPLSKRTDVYGVVTYNQDSLDSNGFGSVDPTVFGVMVGMRHKF